MTRHFKFSIQDYDQTAPNLKTSALLSYSFPTASKLAVTLRRGETTKALFTSLISITYAYCFCQYTIWLFAQLIYSRRLRRTCISKGAVLLPRNVILRKSGAKEAMIVMSAQHAEHVFISILAFYNV